MDCWDAWCQYVCGMKRMSPASISPCCQVMLAKRGKATRSTKSWPAVDRASTPCRLPMGPMLLSNWGCAANLAGIMERRVLTSVRRTRRNLSSHQLRLGNVCVDVWCLILVHQHHLGQSKYQHVSEHDICKTMLLQPVACPPFASRHFPCNCALPTCV